VPDSRASSPAPRALKPWLPKAVTIGDIQLASLIARTEGIETNGGAFPRGIGDHLASLIARTEGIETGREILRRLGEILNSRASSPAPRALKLVQVLQNDAAEPLSRASSPAPRALKPGQFGPGEPTVAASRASSPAPRALKHRVQSHLPTLAVRLASLIARTEGIETSCCACLVCSSCSSREPHRPHRGH